MSFITTGLRELGLKIRRQKTRLALRHEKRLLQKSEINLGREGVAQATNVPELRNEIVALKKLEQEQKEVAVRITQIEEAITQIELQRQENAKEQSASIAKLEEAKKPLVQRRSEAKATTDLGERELAAVENRIQENDAADQQLLQRLTALQGQIPPPADLDAQTAALGMQRARLPEERAELVRARMGSADALRLARDKLAAADAQLDGAEKQITQVREESETRDRALNETSRAQQDSVKEARAHHQTVEERKNPAYLNIGRHLATQRIAPPNAPNLLEEVHVHRTAVDRHQQHTAELALHSSKIDKQELRKFYFVIFSLLFLTAIILPLILQSPAKREWLPSRTDAILSLNLDQVQRDELPKRWRNEQPAVWQDTWTGLVGTASRTPGLNFAKDIRRITRAMTTEGSQRIREFVLVETRADVSPAIGSLAKDPAFQKRSISGLFVWERPDLTVARVGPKTLAVGVASEVDELVRVRLGMTPDLKTTGQLFDRFKALDREVALRLISHNPSSLDRAFHPVFTRELLNSAQLLGLALTLQNPVKAKLVLKCKTTEQATELAANLAKEPQRWLRLQDSGMLLYAQPPEIDRDENNLELRFNVPENSARLLLQRLAKTDAAPPVLAER